MFPCWTRQRKCRKAAGCSPQPRRWQEAPYLSQACSEGLFEVRPLLEPHGKDDAQSYWEAIGLSGKRSYSHWRKAELVEDAECSPSGVFRNNSQHLQIARVHAVFRIGSLVLTNPLSALLCVERMRNRWNLAWSWISASQTAGRDWSTTPLKSTMKRPSSKKWLNVSTSAKAITPIGF